MTLAIQEKFLTENVGRPINPDLAYGYQCVDIPDAYAEAIFGVRWQDSVGGVTGANNLPDVMPDKFWTRINNDPAKPYQLPVRGDVVVWAGTGVNPFGHVALVLSANANGVTVLQQDGFAPPLQFVDGNWYSAKPAHIATLPWYGPGTGMVMAWLTPRPELIKRLPADDFVPAGVSVRPGYYLEQNPNPVAAQFGTRRQPNPKWLSGAIGVHTGEGNTVLAGADAGAENTAKFIATRSDFGSYHVLSDFDSIMPLIRAELEAYADTTNNPHALSVSMALQANRWMDLAPLRRDKIVKNAAIGAALMVKSAVEQKLMSAPVPARRITPAEAIVGSKAGFYGHGETNPGTRYDPGAHFNWDLFLASYAEELNLESPGPAKPAAPLASTPKATAVKTTSYVPDRHWVVESGEYFGLIASYYGDTVGALAQYNGIKNPNKLLVGEWIWPRDGRGTWTVQPGDTLGGIAAWVQKNWSKSVTVDSISNANGINNPNRIKVGMRLQIPK